jgi:hypothetical protein
MNPAGNGLNSCPRPDASSTAKKSYVPPAVKVYGDVRDLTGSGPSSGVHDIALSSPSSPAFS